MSELNECPRLIEVQRLWEGDIDALHAGEVRGHLARCSVCRAEYESWDRLSRHLARADPALSLGDECPGRLKEKLLTNCAASLAEAQEVPHQSGPPWLWGGRWRLSGRIALALAPLAAALLLFYAARTVPRREHRPSQVDARPASPPRQQLEVSPPRLRPEAPRPPRIALTPEPPQPKHSRRNKRPRVAVTARRIVHAARPAPRDRSPEPAPRRIAATPPWERARGPALTARLRRPPPRPQAEAGGDARAPRFTSAKPIERIVIQVDAPPPVETRTVTHVTVIAAGDLEAPGAELTIVRSQKEEVIP